ncbi:MAG TPA: cupin domain-containing protein [Povalibacter sp.]|nr:cupin domain-containing protein [Povalibacter sp.]
MIDFGIGTPEFRERYFEKTPCLFRGALRGRPVAWADLDRLLYQTEPTAQAMQLFHHGTVPPESYTQECMELGQRRRRLHKIRFYGHMRGGATLVLNRLESHLAQARRLCAEVGRFTGQPASGNAYLSFCGDGTFGRHWDTHDVFAIQLIGRKRWQVFTPTLPLPLSHQTSERSDQPCPAVPVIDCTLQVGDVLYVPRGWWHQVLPLEEGSLHFSVGVYAPTTQDYVSWVCARVLAQFVDARRAVDTISMEQMDALAQQLRAAMLDPQCQADFRRTVSAGESPAPEFNLELFLNRRLPLLGDEAQLRLATRASPDESGRLSIRGTVMQLDPVSVRVLRVLSAGDLSFAQLLREMRDISREAVHRAVLDLTGHDILVIEPSASAGQVGESTRATV